MSVVIRGMEMPSKCIECRLMRRCGKDDLDYVCMPARVYVEDLTNAYKPRPEYCPLIELPAQHGRLGDLDAMAFDESEAYMSAQAKLGRDVITTGINSIVHRKIQLLIMDTPTVIEAEEVSE